MKISFGWEVVEWSKENQGNIDKLSRKYGKRYRDVFGRDFTWKRKSRAFERAIRSRQKKIDRTRIPQLREDVWKWRHWYDEEKLKEQEERISGKGIQSFYGRKD
jgi:hypothetical protein